MRVRANSSPYDKFTPEQIVMGDKAEDLGFKWDRVKYPTPAWDMDQDFGKPLFGIPKHIWNIELRLWSTDCAERVLSIWERWASMNDQYETIDMARNLIKLTRDYINNPYYEYKLRQLRIQARNVALECDNLTARHAMYSAIESGEYVGSAAIAAASAVNMDGGGFTPEREWQRTALANRLDAIAPWRLS